MRALFISANTERINVPTMPLGLACVAEATRSAGHEIFLVDLMAESDPGDKIRRVIADFRPEIIGISIRNVDDQDMAKPRFLVDRARGVVIRCRQYASAPIVLGGAGYSIFPSSTLEYLGADMGIQGEGEGTFPLLMERLQQGRSFSTLPGLFQKGRGASKGTGCGFERNLDRFPMPHRDLLATEGYEKESLWLPVQTRRGCPMQCSYCSTETIEGRLIRKRSPGHVVAWLSDCVDAGFHRFHFVDNTFNMPPSYARELCARIIEASLNIQWRCILYPCRVDAALVRDMARAGCREASLGFESGSEPILTAFNKRFSLEDIRHASRLMRDHGIERMGFLLLGGPGETKETVLESLQFLDSLSLENNKLTMGVRIYPYTELARIAREEGIVGERDDLFFPRFYMAPGLYGWLKKTVDAWAKDRPNWMT
jgi:radical SAM superfamily enzyme YgiQ (UPF0313 family)